MEKQVSKQGFRTDRIREKFSKLFKCYRGNKPYIPIQHNKKMFERIDTPYGFAYASSGAIEGRIITNVEVVQSLKSVINACQEKLDRIEIN